LIPILFLTAIFFLNFLARIIFAPLMPTIEVDLGISHSEAGSFFLLTSTGYFIALLASGIFSSRLLHRGTIILSALAVGVVLILTSVTREIWGLRAALLLLGMASGLYLPSGIATLTNLSDARRWGRTIAIHELAPNLGFVTAPLLSEMLLLWFSWHTILAVLGIFSIVLGLTYAFGSFGGRFPGKAPSLEAFRPLIRQRSFWIMMALFSLGIGGSFGIFTMLPLYLVKEQGFDQGWANSLVGLSRISGVGMAFAAGWAVDRFGHKHTLVSVLLLTGVTTVLLGTVTGPSLVIMVFLQPLLAVCFFPAGFAALALLSSESTRNLAVSLTIPAAFILGGGAIPILIGAMGDAGAFSLGIVLSGLIVLSGGFLSAFIKAPMANED
jgi:NNP family nitrate/nitrite transporter-like MFS transporter